MHLEQVCIPFNNKILEHYDAQHETMAAFFPYGVSDEEFQRRYTYLKQQPRTAGLAEAIRAYMTPFGLTEAIEQNITALANGAVAIVGGQQAGVFTGPLYSVYKAITVLVVAKQQQQNLQAPVVPVFWIAGEDHDLEEINHTYTIAQQQVKKRGYSERVTRKTMASTTKLSQEAIVQLIETVFFDYGETAYTAQLVEQLKEAAAKSETFTDFFTHVMNGFFSAHGLLMIDAASANMRQLESAYFERLINAAPSIAQAVTATEAQFDKAGYGTPIMAQPNNANIFYVREGERFLLTYKDGVFSNAQANVHFTSAQLKNIAKNTPEQLSNNVVTRPMMQEMVFPVLAFVGGPGELAYWATLANGFEQVGLQMPIFVPRFMFTIVDKTIEKCAEQLELDIPTVIAHGVTQQREAFIASLQTQQVTSPVLQMEQQLREQYVQLQSFLQQQHIHLDNVLAKNMKQHTQQLDYLMAKIEEQVLRQHDTTLQHYDVLAHQLRPNGSYQERVFAPHYMLNKYGEDFVDRLLRLTYSVNNTHKIIFV